MFKTVMLMQLRVMMYIESKKYAVFVLVSVICTYKQSLNKLHNLTLLVSLETTTYTLLLHSHV